MKTASYLRISVALVTMTAIACSDPIEPVTPHPTPGPGTSGQTDQREYHTGGTTWTQGDYGRFVGLVTQTTGDLATVDVLVVNNGKRIPVYKELDPTTAQNSIRANGEYYWSSYENSVLLLHYMGKTVESPPPFPLEVIIVY